MTSLQSILLSLLSTGLNAILPIAIAWIQKLVLPTHPAVQGVDKAAVRATVRQWVVDMFSEISASLSSKIPSWITPFIPAIDTVLAQAIDAALDAANL